MSRVVYEEARLAYVQGLFVSCILLAQVFVEHTLAGFFQMAGYDSIADGKYHVMLKKSLEHQYLSAGEFGVFNRLRRERNPYAHGRRPGTGDDVATRAVASDSTVADVIARDATEAITSLMTLVSRPPFTVT